MTSQQVSGSILQSSRLCFIARWLQTIICWDWNCLIFVWYDLTLYLACIWQIIIQLKKFNQQAIKAQQVASARQQAYSSVRPTSSRATDVELRDIIGKPNSERLDIDASPLGEIRAFSSYDILLSSCINDLLSILHPPSSWSNTLPLAWSLCLSGVAKRVILVIIAGAVLGTVLFYAGLESLFPKY